MKRTYIIMAYHSLTLDSYENGQDTSPISEWTDEHQFQANNPREAIETYYKDINQDPDFNTIDGHKLYTSHLVDSENIAPTDEELHLWKQGRFKLYNLDINVNVYHLAEEDIE